MGKLMNRVEAAMTGLIWIAATVLLPMAALTPIEGDGRATAGTMVASATCLNMAVDILRACPATSL